VNYHIQCDHCGARVWASGSYDFDPDSGPECEVDDIPDEWEPNPKLEYLLIEWCNHVEFTIIDTEEDGPLEDDVW
jgi:hypothetical protein